MASKTTITNRKRVNQDASNGNQTIHDQDKDLGLPTRSKSKSNPNVKDSKQNGTNAKDGKSKVKSTKTTNRKEKTKGTKHKKSAFWFCAECIAVTLIVVQVIAPVIVHFSPYIQNHLIFLAFVRWPPFADVTRPQDFGLINVRNFYVNVDEDIKLGVWHCLPPSLASEEELKSPEDQQIYFEKALQSGKPVILYMHGNSGSRASLHRVKLYEVLQSLDVHVIAFDYRGYADSASVVPSEDGVVEDGKYMFRWVKERVGNSAVFIWGHSLGTGVSTKAVYQLRLQKEYPHGLILESPFNNLADEIKFHPLSIMHRWLPYFDWILTEPMEANGLQFQSEKWIAGVHTPLLILHADDDMVIPIALAYKLYDSAKRLRPRHAPNVQFVVFDDQHDYGHRYICNAPELPKLITDFVNFGSNFKLFPDEPAIVSSHKISSENDGQIIIK